LHAAGEFFLPGNAVAVWLPLAACAAVLNRLNGSHIAHALFRRWVLMLYAECSITASGYDQTLQGGALPVSGASWIGCFVLYLAYSWRILPGPTSGSAGGCSAPRRRPSMNENQ
jgi:hypothetical protein